MLMLPLLKAIAGQENFPLPLAYIQHLKEAVVGVVEGLENLYRQLLKRYDSFLWTQSVCIINQELQ